MKPDAPSVRALDWLVARHPLRWHHSALPSAVLIAAKLLALHSAHARWRHGFGSPFLSFIPGIESAPLASLWAPLLTGLFWVGQGLLLFNFAPRLGAGAVGGALLLDLLAARGRFSNNSLLFALLLVLVALSGPEDRRRLGFRLQLALVYGGAALNKLLHPDWRDGAYMRFWTRDILHLDWFSRLDLAADGRLSWMLGWFAIGVETVLAVLVLWPRHTVLFLVLSLAFHLGMLVFSGGVLSWVFLHVMLAACLCLVEGPPAPPAPSAAPVLGGWRVWRVLLPPLPDLRNPPRAWLLFAAGLAGFLVF